MSLANSCAVSQWTSTRTSKTVDQILVEARRRFHVSKTGKTLLKAFPNTETIPLNYLPGRVRWAEKTADLTKPNHLPIEATQKQTQISPNEAQTNDQSPITVTDR